jgi:hypothetical protein
MSIKEIRKFEINCDGCGDSMVVECKDWKHPLPEGWDTVKLNGKFVEYYFHYCEACMAKLRDQMED